MSSQFVDINADKKRDILVGSFSGVPQIIMGMNKGFSPPESVMDKSGETVLINAFWNYDDKKWDKTDRSKSEGHCTSVAAVDWDNDGDLDLILGDYYGGRLFYRLNEGTKTEPKFSKTNMPVLTEGEPIVIKDGLAAPRVVDWNGDGLFDILCGGSKGGVFAFINKGTKTEPKFKQPQTLIAPIEDKTNSYIKLVPGKDGLPTLPGSSYHIEAVDYDRDGDLDLLVGARSSWKKENARKLTDKEKEELAKIVEERKEVMTEYTKLFADIKNQDEQKKVMESKEFKAMQKKLSALFQKEQKYNVDPNMSGDFVWLYRRN